MFKDDFGLGRCCLSKLGIPMDATVSIMASIMMGFFKNRVIKEAKRLAKAAPLLKPINTMYWI